MPIKFLNFEDDAASIITVRVENGPSERVVFYRKLLTSAAFRNVVQPLQANVDLFALGIARASETSNLRGIHHRARETAPALRQSFQDIGNAGRQKLSDIANVRNDQLGRHKVDPARSVAIATRLSAMKIADASRLALTDPEVAVSALQNWAIGGLPDALRQQIENSLILHNLTTTYLAHHPLKPSFIDPIPNGFDRDAAMTNAKAAMKAHEDGVAEVDLVRSMLTSVVNFVAVATDQHPVVAFDLLNGKAA
ncbi:hypothetical protein [Rhizobium sp. Root1220]|uniref:hypothetical protein n=1 Tax=Rhizobium sp. Root1220 TaxID=1736432 RepID=UPI0006F264B4|nr:hypothetical protein [Rhizobium sp. Root1220]KQV73024.1 hypothetical protein ASC90_06315 [Rhizobium sp. Root1220]